MPSHAIWEAAPRSRARVPAALILLGLLFCSLRLPAQNTVEELRARARAGEAVQVLERIQAMAHAKEASFEHLLLGAELALDRPDLRAAFDLIAAMQRMKPDDPRPYTWLGHATFAEGRAAHSLRQATFSDAATHYREARKRGGDAYDNAYWEAEAWMEANEKTEALAATEAALEARPGDVAALKLEAEILLRLRRFAEAAGLIGPAWKESPGDPALSLLLLRARIAQGEREHCRDEFLRMVKANPRNVELYRTLCDGLKDRKRPDDTAFLRDVLEAARGIHAGTGLPAFYLGYTAALENRLQEALRLFREYCEANPRDGLGHLYVGSVQTSIGQLAQARASLLEANSLGDVDPEVVASEMRRLVAAYVAGNDYGNAVSLQAVVLSLADDPNDTRDMGVLQLSGGDRPAAVRTYRGLLERNDLDFVARAATENYLALALWAGGDLKGALSAFSRALDADESYLDALENKGILLIQLGRRDEARACLESVVAAGGDRDDSRARYHLLRLTYPDLVEGR